MDIKAQKQKLRAEIRARKLTLSPAEMLAQAETVFTRLASLPEFEAARTVLAYWALPDELPTAQFVNALVGIKRLALPVVRGEDLILCEYTGPGCLQPVPPFGIEEPQSTATIAPEEIDLVIVPGLAFDPQKQRLGRGRGYYDRLFPQMPQATRVGICLREQLVDHVPCETHDQAMHHVISPGQS